MEAKTLIIWILGLFSSFISLVGTAVFRSIFRKLNELDKDHQAHKNQVQSDFEKIRLELQNNKKDDEHRHQLMMQELKNLTKVQNEMLDQMKQWQKNIENFYYQNPNLKKPDAR